MFTNFTNSRKIPFLIFPLISIFIMASSHAYGQGKILNGYVITTRGDTLNGYIRFKDWDENPPFIDFSKDPSGKSGERLKPESVQEFSIPSVQLTYKSKKIGMLDIDLTQSYARFPYQPKIDSLVAFLKQVTSGTKASLFLYSAPSGISHFYLEKEGALIELLNYSYYRMLGDRKYLAVYDEYKNQLPQLLGDSKITQNTPRYSLQGLRNYVDKYNESFGELTESPITGQRESGFSFDLGINGGFEGWKSEDQNLNMKNKMTYGFGFRVNLPKKFQNRYVKMNVSFIPGLSVKEIYGYNMDEKITFKTVEVGFGTHFGNRNLRPFVGVDVSFPLNFWRYAALGPHFGIGFRRNLNLEISHLANLYSLISKDSFINRPRVSLNYYLNINSLFRKK